MKMKSENTTLKCWSGCSVLRASLRCESKTTRHYLLLPVSSPNVNRFSQFTDRLISKFANGRRNNQRLGIGWTKVTTTVGILATWSGLLTKYDGAVPWRQRNAITHGRKRILPGVRGQWSSRSGRLMCCDFLTAKISGAAAFSTDCAILHCTGVPPRSVTE